MTLNVFSMFDGVGGFIVGLDNANKELNKPVFNTLYSNQFEPSRKSQDAYEVGLYQFPEVNHSNKDIELWEDSEFQELKDNGVNMIVGGFPCQDYSVARSKKNEMGIEGKKGVLFWSIIRAVEVIKPEYLILENVDRLLKSPSKQRGRDFAVMLGAFNQLGYSVEWRVINAADYGFAQRRRRVFFFVYRNDSAFANQLSDKYNTEITDNFSDVDNNVFDHYIFKDGLFARQFPIQQVANKNRRYQHVLSDISADDHEKYILDISDNFTGQVWNTGIMRNGKYYTVDTLPLGNEVPITLGEIAKEAKKTEPIIPENIFISDETKIKKFEELRGAKKKERTTSEGFTYTFSEGSMSPYDKFELPARTMLTSEGTINRSTHLLKEDGKFRFLTPIEAELIQDFPANWTKYKKNKDTGEISEVSTRMRYFFMGNALVTGIVKRIGIELGKI